MIRNERRCLKEQAAARKETKAQDEAILRSRTPLERAFKSLEFELDDTAYWRLPSGYQLVLMYEWPDEDNNFTPSYDVDIRGYGDIDITKCPLYYKYDRYSFSNMSSTDVVHLAEWIEKYAPINERHSNGHMGSTSPDRGDDGERPAVTYADKGGKYQGQTGVNLGKVE